LAFSLRFLPFGNHTGYSNIHTGMPYLEQITEIGANTGTDTGIDQGERGWPSPTDRLAAPLDGSNLMRQY
jgi:hypothetical protein